MEYLKQVHGVSIRRACRIAGISDSVYRYRRDISRDDPVIAALHRATERYPAYGFSKLFKVLRRWGHGWNHKRVHRLYCVLNLNKRRRGKKTAPDTKPGAIERAGHHKSMLVHGLHERQPVLWSPVPDV